MVTTVIRGRPEERAWRWRSDAAVFVVGYETLRGDAMSSGSVSRSRIWDVVVLDEAQRIKNAETQTAKACKRLRCRRAWALTGTPLENRLEDLASILEFVDGVASQAGQHAGPRYGATPALRRRLAAVQLRRRKHDVLPELPPKRVIDVLVELGPEQRASYERAERDGLVHLRTLGEEVTIQHVLELIVRLKQICNADPRSGHSAKLDDIVTRIGTLVDEGHRAIVFSQFTDAGYGVARIARELAQFDPLTYTGAMDASERDSVVRRFRDELWHGVLALSLRAGGLGLNLQSASFVFHVDRWWNPALERQAEDRSHRMGQRYPVTVYRYTCTGTVEQRIADILARKQQLFDEIVDDVSIDVREPLTTRELFAALGLG